MKNLTVLFSAIGFLLVAVAGCKEKDTILEIKIEMPSISVTAPGLAITDNIINVSVSKDSTVVIDYTITAPAGGISALTLTIDGVEEIIEEANGKEEFTGKLTVDVPYEEKVIALEFDVTDGDSQAASNELSIDVVLVELVYGGETGGIRWEADKLSEGGILKLFDAESRFGTKLNPLPMYFFDFSTGSAAPHPTYSRKDGTKITQTVGATSTEQIPPGKIQSWKAPLMELPYGSSVVKIQDTDFAPGVSIFVRRFWTHDGNLDGLIPSGRFNHKLCRLTPKNGINPYYQYDRLLMEGSPGKAAEYWSGATFHTPFVRTWVLDEVRYVASSVIDAADASIHLRRNGAFVDQIVNTISRSTALPGQWEYLAIDQIHNLSEVPQGFAVYYDMLAVDDSEQRVMLTNNANLSLATEKEYLPATVWVDNEIQVYLRQGTFVSIQGKYICIQDGEGNQIGVGIQLQ